MSRKYFINANAIFFKTNFSDHDLQLENDLFQFQFIPLPVVIDTSLRLTNHYKCINGKDWLEMVKQINLSLYLLRACQ